MSDSYDHGYDEGFRASFLAPKRAASNLELREAAVDGATPRSVLAAVRERLRIADVEAEAAAAANTAEGKEWDRGGVLNAGDHWRGVHDALREQWGVAGSHTFNHVAILRGTFGCPCGRHLRADPYPFRSDDQWNAAARGDGRSYSGEVEKVWRAAGESDDDLVARAARRAAEMEAAERAAGNGCDR